MTAFNTESLHLLKEGSIPQEVASTAVNPFSKGREWLARKALEHNSRSSAETMMARDGVEQIERLVKERRARLAEMPDRARLIALMALLGAQHHDAPRDQR